MSADHIKIGEIGEKIAENYLRRKKYRIVERNYRKKWGEIDIIVRTKDKVHFVEVKTVSYETRTHEQVGGTWRPEENVDRRKIQKLYRTIESWMLENDYYGEWQIDVVAIRYNSETKHGTVKHIPNIVAD